MVRVRADSMHESDTSRQKVERERERARESLKRDTTSLFFGYT
jgi:hypothetical protein